MRRYPIFLLLLIGLFLTGWGHEGPRVEVGVVHDISASGTLSSFLSKFDHALEGQNASRPGADSGERFNDVLNGKTAAAVFVLQDPGRAVDQAVRAREKGLPVLSVGRPMPDDSQDFLIAYDPQKEGELQAHGALAKAPKGLYLLAGRTGKDWFRKEFREGQLRALKDAVTRGDIRLSINSKDLPRAAAVLTFGGEDALNWATKIQKMGKGDKVVLGTVGQDLGTCQALAQGRPWISVYESPAKLAEETAYLAVKAARKAKTFDCQFTDVPNGKGIVRTVLLTPKVLDASTLERTVLKDGIWKKDQLGSGTKP